MEKKWWFLVGIFLIMAVAIFSTAMFLDKKPVKRLQGGVIIMPGDFRNPDNSGINSDAPTIEGDNSQPFEDSLNGINGTSGLTCWECSLGGKIINVQVEDLNNLMVQNLTNCTNVSQLIQIECSFFNNQTNQTNNVICGDGICSGNEAVESCPQDCPRYFSPEETKDKINGQGEKEIGVTEKAKEKPAIEFYYDLTFDNKCVRLRKVTGKEIDRCDPENPTVQLSGHVTGVEPSLSPMKRSFFGCIFGKMFGLPWC